MAWSQFNYWRRDSWIEKPLTKVPKGSKEPLVWHQIQRGDFDPSPYWDMADKEIVMFEEEMAKYEAKHPSMHRLDYQEHYRKRWAVYNKRIIKLRDEHWKHDESRMELLKKGLIKAFRVDVWDEVLEECDGDPKEFYRTYKKKAKYIN